MILNCELNVPKRHIQLMLPSRNLNQSRRSDPGRPGPGGGSIPVRYRQVRDRTGGPAAAAPGRARPRTRNLRGQPARTAPRRAGLAHLRAAADPARAQLADRACIGPKRYELAELGMCPLSDDDIVRLAAATGTAARQVQDAPA